MSLQQNGKSNCNNCSSNYGDNDAMEQQTCYYEETSFIPSIKNTDKLILDDFVNDVSSITTPKNLIVMIGDGMGTVYNTAYRHYKGQDRTILDKIFKGRYSTDPLNNTITDSAAGAAAFSIGKKTFNGNIATDIAGNPFGTILEALKRKGKGTGLVVTKSVTDATPASFASHTLNRNFHDLIAKQLATLHQDYGWTNCTVVDILMGGGKMHFDSWGFNATSYKDYGWNKYLNDNSSLYTLCPEDIPIIGLFADNEMPYYLDLIHSNINDQPSLLDMSRISIDLLNKTYNEEGFFMMIEGSSIDMCGHLNDIACMLWEMEQFMDTVDYVLNWANEDNDTLVVILADHKTGGLSIGRTDSFEKDKTLNGYSLHGMTEQDIIEYYGDYKENPLITTKETEGRIYQYLWHPEIVKDIKHTTQWFNDTVTAQNMDIESIFDLIEGDDGWFPLSNKEKAFLNYTFVNGGKMDQALVHIINVRTVTGFTTHGHVAVDVAVYAHGVSADSFNGHWKNNEIGQLLTKIMDCIQEQNEQTLLLQNMFINGTLKLCDPKQKPPIIEWNNSIPYPWGNLLYPQNCVDEWL